MRSRRLLLAAVGLVLAVAAAGCLASGNSGSAAASGTPAEAPAQADSQGQANGTSTSRTNATTGANVTWKNQTRRGTFTGARAGVGVFGATETFGVSKGATKLVLVVRAPDARLGGSITPPCDGCQSEDYETHPDRYTFTRSNPAAGDWSVSFFREEPGVATHDYVLEIHRKVAAGR